MYLRQSTIATIKMGPFLDDTDGKTPETALTPAVKVSKNGGAFGARSSATATSHDTDGYYSVELNATDTNTIGRLRVSSNTAGALPVWDSFVVLHANVYDSLFGTVALSTYAGGAVAVSGTVVLDATQPNYAPSKAGDAMALTSGERTSIRQEMDTNSTRLANLDVAVSTRLATSGYTAPPTPPTVTQIRQEMDTNSTKLANLDTTVGSRLAGSGYTVPPTTGEITTAVTAGLSGSLTGIQSSVDAVGVTVDAINSKTTNLPASPAGVGDAMAVSDKTGFKLASDGLDQLPTTLTGPMSGWKWPQWMLWGNLKLRRSRKDKTTGIISVYNADQTSVISTQTTTNTETEQTVGAPQ